MYILHVLNSFIPKSLNFVILKSKENFFLFLFYYIKLRNIINVFFMFNSFQAAITHAFYALIHLLVSLK